jgi:hypothetical protein
MGEIKKKDQLKKDKKITRVNQSDLWPGHETEITS